MEQIHSKSTANRCSRLWI